MKEERDEKNNKTELKREQKKANGGDGGMVLKEERGRRAIDGKGRK